MTTCHVFYPQRPVVILGTNDIFSFTYFNLCLETKESSAELIFWPGHTQRFQSSIQKLTLHSSLTLFCSRKYRKSFIRVSFRVWETILYNSIPLVPFICPCFKKEQSYEKKRKRRAKRGCRKTCFCTLKNRKFAVYTIFKRCPWFSGEHISKIRTKTLLCKYQTADLMNLVSELL